MSHIHSTALIDPLAEIHPSAQIGAYVVIEGPVKIGPDCVVKPHAQLLGDTALGEGCVIGRAAIVGEDPQDLGFKADAIRSGVRLGPRNVIREQVTIHRGSKEGSYTTLGEGNYLMANAHLAHDVQLGDRNILANGVLIAGHVQVGNHTFMGGSAVFHQFLRIGDYCVVQGNGSFSKDIPHYCAAQRINRVTGLNVIGLRRQGFTTEERQQMKALFDLLFRSGRNLSQAIAAAKVQSWPERVLRLLQFVEAPSKKGVCRVRLEDEDDA